MNDQTRTEEVFDEILLGSIDEALIDLGGSAKTSLYFFLEKNFNLKRQEIPTRIDDFSDALLTIFGLAARPLEILLIRTLNAKVSSMVKSQVPKRDPQVTFKEHVQLVKSQFENTNWPHEGLTFALSAIEQQEQL